MCRPVSGWAAVVSGEPVLWVSETSDSHTKTAAEFRLRDTGTHRLGAWECYPDVKSPSPDTDTWIVEWDSAATATLRGEPDWLSLIHISEPTRLLSISSSDTS